MALVNFLTNIKNAIEGEDFECVILCNESIGYISNDPRDIDVKYINIPLSMKQVELLFNYEYYDGFGGQDCHNIFIYTRQKIYYVHEYDGSTELRSVPRNPPTST
jgi:hypothetical protein